jgi:hypothetical protein
MTSRQDRPGAKEQMESTDAEMPESKTIPPVRRYADGQVIEYTSFAPNGYSLGQVIHYAALDEQDNPADPRVYIRAGSGSKPFPMRESQLRDPQQLAEENAVPSIFEDIPAVGAAAVDAQEPAREATAPHADAPLPGRGNLNKEAGERDHQGQDAG